MSIPPWQRPPICEHTAPGSTTEAIDCWEDATVRVVSDGVTVGVFCNDHVPDPLGDRTLEPIEQQEA